ncbi:hypothetical protein, partial [Salinicola socius]
EQAETRGEQAADATPTSAESSDTAPEPKAPDASVSVAESDGELRRSRRRRAHNDPREKRRLESGQGDS